MPTRLRGARGPLLLLAALVGPIVLAMAGAARADVMVAELTANVPIAAHGGWVAWSAYDSGTGRFRLMVAPHGGAPAAAPVAGARRAFDVSLGPGTRGRTVALYTRCRQIDRGCDVYRYDLVSRRETRLAAVSSPQEDEAWPVQWGDRVAFVRRHATGGRGEIEDCDVPFVKTLSSRAPSRRLDRGSCARVTGMSLRGTRLVEVTFGSSPPATRFDSQVRLLDARGGAVRVLARQGSGEESNIFASPGQTARTIRVTRTGVHPQPAFVGIDAASGRPTEVLAHANLTGPLAVDERGDTWYVEGGEFRGDDCAHSPVPCRLVRASADPLSATERPLLASLTISSPSAATPAPVFGDPFVLSGRLARTIVSGSRVVRTEPIPGIRLELLRRVTVPGGTNERFEPTGVFATTGPGGSWSVSLAAPPAEPWFSAVTRTGAPEVPTTYAGRGTVGTVDARITLTVAGSSFAGTISPAQPGRTVKIQRLISRKCQTARDGSKSCVDRWTTVGDAPVNAAGTAFAATIPGLAAGTYTAALPFADRSDPSAYSGRSPDVAVG
jgi:hypothetical protein